MNPTVSVVIPCFNLGGYLDEAVQSVLGQTYEDFEILVVDDGSDDEATRHLLASYRRPRTRILRTENRGVASARNSGLSAAAGRYICFLDADDVLESRFLERTVGVLEADDSLAFASCWLTAFGETEFTWEPEHCDLPWLLAEDTVCTASPTRREALEAVSGFDEDPRLDGFEDWDLAISLAENGLPGSIVRERLFRYRMRPGSKWTVRGRPENYAHAFKQLVDKHSASYREHAPAVVDTIGRRISELEKLLPGEAPPSPAVGDADWRRAIISLEDHRRRLEELVTGGSGPRADGASPGGAVEWGSLRRLEPVSRVWGLDRGKPIDRHYIELFLDTHADAIAGDVLEVKDPGYTKRFQTGARSVTVLDISEANHDATLVADLEGSSALPAARFDCVVLTQTAHLIFEVEQEIQNVHEALAPGGVALATLPCLSRLDYEAGLEGDFWRFTPASARRLFEGVFGAGNVEVEAFGNLLTCTAFLQGLAAEELEPAELESHDPYFPLLIGLRAVKAPSAPSVDPPLPDVEGSVDQVSCTAISGWAWSPGAPERRLRLEIWSGEKRIGEAWSDQPRADLAEAGKGAGRVAFRFLPDTPLHGESTEVTVIPAGGAAPLPGCPRQVECRCAQLPAEPSPALAGAAIDAPPPGTPLDFPWLDLTGWALGRDAPVEGVELISGGALCRRLPTGVARPDLARAFPDLDWARGAGFATRVSLVGSGGAVDLELRAVLPDGARVPIGRIAGPATETPPAPVVAVLEPRGQDANDYPALLNQQTPISRVLVRQGAAVTRHPGFVAAPSWNQALDDGSALVWLCDGQEEVTTTFLSEAAAALSGDSALSFAIASEGAARPAAGRELIGALSGTALGCTLLFRASAARAVGALDEGADSAAAALWDLAVRLAEAGHEWVEVRAARPGGTTLAERGGEPALRWLYGKHEALYRHHLAEVVLDREVLIGELLRENHLQERALEEQLRPRLRARRRERDRLAAKLRRRRAGPADSERRAGSDLGDFWRLEPISPLWGDERGLCVDRYYIERFLGRHAGDVRGTVLASPDAVYARRFGGSRVDHCDVLDADPTNGEATIVAPLDHVPEVATAAYDCALLPHVLHLVEHPLAVLAEWRRMLKPGGVLLASVPCAARLEPDADESDRWRFSPQGLISLLEAAFAAGDLEVRGEGNREALLASLIGMAAEEIETDRLERDDPSMPVLVTARVVAPGLEAPA